MYEEDEHAELQGCFSNERIPEFMGDEDKYVLHVKSGLLFHRVVELKL